MNLKVFNLLFAGVILIFISQSCLENSKQKDKVCEISAFSSLVEMKSELSKDSSYNIVNYLRMSKTFWVPEYLTNNKSDTTAIQILMWPWLIQPNYYPHRITMFLSDRLVDQSVKYKKLLLNNIFCEDSCFSSVSQSSSSITRKRISNIGNECLMILSNSQALGGMLESPDIENSIIDSVKLTFFQD
jgi:hypothetical protein